VEVSRPRGDRRGGALSEEELAETGIAEIRRALTVLSQISAEGMRIRGIRTSFLHRHD